MCGLCGMIAPNFKGKRDRKSRQAELNFLHLLIANEERGIESTGIAKIGTEKRDIHKFPVRPRVMIFHTYMETILPFNFADTPVIFGHSRRSTHGKINKENAHPFLIEDTLGMHNGKVDGEFDNGMDRKQYPVDSQRLLLSINNVGIHETFRRCLGAAVVVFIKKNSTKVTFIRKNNPLSFLYDPETKILYWSSLDTHLKEIEVSKDSILVDQPNLTWTEIDFSKEIDIKNLNYTELPPYESPRTIGFRHSYNDDQYQEEMAYLLGCGVHKHSTHIDKDYRGQTPKRHRSLVITETEKVKEYIYTFDSKPIFLVCTNDVNRIIDIMLAMDLASILKNGVHSLGVKYEPDEISIRAMEQTGTASLYGNGQECDFCSLKFSREVGLKQVKMGKDIFSICPMCLFVADLVFKKDQTHLEEPKKENDNPTNEVVNLENVNVENLTTNGDKADVIVK